MAKKNNGEEQQTPPQEQTPPEKTVIVISDEASLTEAVKEQFASVGPSLEIVVPSIEQVIEAHYEPEVAEKIVAKEKFKAEVLAELKAEAAKAPPPPAPSEEPFYLATTKILFDNVEYIDGDPIKVTGEQAAQLLSVGAIRELKKKES